MSYFFDFRASDRGGLLASDITLWDDASPLTPEQFAGQVNGKDVLFAVHGFNVDRQEGIAALGNWEPALTLNGAVYVGVLWPGDSSWLHGLDYPIEGGEAVATAKMLAAFANKWLTGTLSLSFVSHSLGARVVLETVRLLQRRTRRVLMMAGAVNDDCLLADYAAAAAKIDAISVLASRQDEVLEIAFPAGNFLAGIFEQGVPYWHAALGREGPYPAAPSNLSAEWQIPDAWNFGHGSYLPGAAISPPPLAPPLPFPPSPPADPAPPASTAKWTGGWASTQFA